MSDVNFAQLGLCDPILKVLKEEGYVIPTPIQAQGIPPVLQGHDVLGCAQTGTGKTAAFALPILHRFALHAAENPGQASSANRKIRALILSPTRELANQIDESFRTYGRHLHLRSTVVFGGVSQMHQERALRKGVDFLVATPGRLLDLAEQRIVDLSHVEVLVLDEADNMLDMGFIHDIRRIITRLPAKRQNLLFSATMPREIRELADTILVNPVTVTVTPISSAVDTVEQSVYMVERKNKNALLMHFLQNNGITRVLVFTRTKHGADKVVKHLERNGVFSVAIHGNKNQNARNRAIQAFKSQRPPVLVATDIAARGLDIDAVSHVVNFDIPNVPETYVHRIGRTGRAGATGDAVSFCDHEERSWLRGIERLTKKSIPVRADHPEYTGGNNMPTGREGGRDGNRDSRDSHRDQQNDGHRDSHRDGQRDGQRNERWGTFDAPKARFPRHASKPAHPMAPAAAASNDISDLPEDDHDLSEFLSEQMESGPAAHQPALRNQHSTGGSFLPGKGFTPSKKKEHRKGKSQVHRTGAAPAADVMHVSPKTPVAEGSETPHTTTAKIHATKHAVAPKPHAKPHATTSHSVATHSGTSHATPRSNDRKPFGKKPFGDRRPFGERPFNRNRDDRSPAPHAKHTGGTPRPAGGPKKDFAKPGAGVKSFGNNSRKG